MRGMLVEGQLCLKKESFYEKSWMFFRVIWTNRYDVPHHGRIEPSSPREEEPESKSSMVNYKGPITRSRAKFVNLVTYLDSKEAFGSIEGNWSHFSGQNERDEIFSKTWSQRCGAEARVDQTFSLDFPFQVSFFSNFNLGVIFLIFPTRKFKNNCLLFSFLFSTLS